MRLGLLLRLHRFCDPRGRYPRQADLLTALRAAGHHATTTTLSRAESGALRSGALLRGYEEVLGLEDGTLCATADALARDQSAAPLDRDPVPVEHDVRALSVLTAEVLGDDAPPGAWFAFGRAFARPDTRGLPVPMMTEALHRLDRALRTSSGVAWVMQREALLLLAAGPYAVLVPELAADPPKRLELPAPRTEPRTKDRRNRDWTWSHEASHALTAARELPEQPVLARALYDVLADPDDDRALHAGITLAALPFAREAIAVVREGGAQHPERCVRERAARRLEVGWARS